MQPIVVNRKKLDGELLVKTYNIIANFVVGQESWENEHYKTVVEGFGKPHS